MIFWQPCGKPVSQTPDPVLSPGIVTCYTVNPQGLHSTWPLLCLWTWSIFFGGFQWPPVDSRSIASCDFGVLAGGDELTSSTSPS